MYQPEPACGPYITTLASVSVSYGSALYTVIALSHGNPSLPEFIMGGIRAGVSMVSGWGWRGWLFLRWFVRKAAFELCAIGGRI